MPYAIRKATGTNKYFVVNRITGRKFSKLPLPRERAERQLKAIYANTRSLKGGFKGGWLLSFFSSVF